MSNTDTTDEITACVAPDQEPMMKILPLRPSIIGPNQPVWRALPNQQQRMIGPWCFLDRIGPMELHGDAPLDVPPHPHTALQTVTWLLDGALLHRDSLGTEQTISPGQLNLMTAGRGIAHSEQSPSDAQSISGVQFWIALPDWEADREPAFEHHSELPEVELEGATARVIVGRFAGEQSPATTYSPLAGAEVVVSRAHRVEIPLEPEFEYGILLLEGHADIEEHTLTTDTLVYLGSLRRYLSVDAQAGTRLLVFGGEPLEEDILLWWNFVGRSPDEIRAAREDWQQHRRFGEVAGYSGSRLEAPELSGRIR